MAFANFNDIRSSRGSSIKKLMTEVDKINSGSAGGNSKNDDRYWQPEVDKAGNGMATIRFLPAAPDNDYPWARVFNHGFKNELNNKWYIEECPTTIGEKCYCCEQNSELWNTGVKENQDIVRSRKRHLQYICNIIVVKDPKNPENEGKVKLFKFGKKIFDKIKEAMQPKFEDETPIDPFDFWEGANFKLKICKVEGYRNYDRSEFESQSAVSSDDDEIESIWKQEHDLKEFTAATRFKSYDELKARYTAVFGGGSVPTAQQQAEDELNDFVAPSAPARKQEAKPSVPPRKATPAPAPTPVGDDDEAAYFASLLDD